MKLYKLSLLALALAGTMVACSDDDYSQAAPTPGAFFPVDSPDVIELPATGNSVDIPVRRNTPNISLDETFKISATDPSGLFNIPASVTFISNESVAMIHVTYDEAKIVNDEKYPVTLTIDGMTNEWGKNTYKFSLGRITPMEIENMKNAVWIYGGLLTGGGQYDVTKSVNPLEPHLEYYTVHNWFDYPENGCELNITVHKDVILENGYPYAEFGMTTIPFASSYDYIQVAEIVKWVEWRFDLTFEEIRDKYGFSLQTTTGKVILTPDMVSYYDTDRGVFHFTDNYSAFKDGEYEGSFPDGHELLYLPGFPNYDVEINYLGYFTNADDEITVMGELYAGSDVETVEVYNVAGDDIKAALAAIEAGQLEGEEIKPTTTDAISVSFPVAGAGTYTMIAVAYGDGEVQGADYSTYTIAGAAAPAGSWSSIGTGIFIDGWVMPAFSISNVQVNPFDYPFEIEIQKNNEVEGEYRAVSPYTSANYPLGSQNPNTKACDIVFNIEDPDFPTVAFQNSGFTFKGEGALWISEANWYFVNVLGVSKDQVLANQGVQDKLSYYEDGTLEIPLPLFAANDNNEFTSNIDDLGYNWNGGYPTEIIMPDAASGKAPAAKAIRKAVSKDSFNFTGKTNNNSFRDLRKKNPRLEMGVRLNKVMVTEDSFATIR